MLISHETKKNRGVRQAIGCCYHNRALNIGCLFCKRPRKNYLDLFSSVIYKLALPLEENTIIQASQEMGQSSGRQTRQSVRSEADTLPLLRSAHGNQVRETRPIPRNARRQEKPKPAHWPTRPLSVDKINCPQTRSGYTPQASSKAECPCEGESVDIYEHESVADQREHVRLRWMGRLRRMPHRQQSEEQGC